MLNRIYYVLLTYVTRPMFWVLITFYAAVAFVSAGMDFKGVREESVAPELPQPGRVLYLIGPDSTQKFDIGNFDRGIGTATIFWHNEIAEGRKIERILPDGRREEVLYTAFSAKHLRQLKECPHLKSLDLRYRSQLKDDEWQTLGDLGQLEALKYDGAVSPFGMRQIARLTRLRFLDLSGCTFQDGLEGLESLPSLHTLVLENFEEDRVHLLGQLRNLPHLRTLVSTYYRLAGSKGFHAIWEADLGNLQAAASLRRWFVDEKAHGFPGFDTLQKQLPHVGVRPIQVNIGRQVRLVPVFVLTCILIFLLALQLNSHFTHPAAMLTPGYVLPHLIPATLLWLCSMLAHLWLLTAGGVTLLPALGITMGLWLVLGVALSTSRVVRTSKTSPAWFVTLIGVTLFYAPVHWMQSRSSSLDWFLRGQQPVLAAVIITAGVLVYGLVVWQLCRLHSRLQEMGMDTPPLGFDRREMAAWQERSLGRRQSDGGARSWWRNLSDRRLAYTIAQAGGKGWRRRGNLWIAGNSVTGIHIVAFVFALALVGFGISSVQDISDEFKPDLSSPLSSAASMGLLSFPDYGLFFFGFLWWARRRFLAVESLRPTSRPQFVRELATAFACDFLPFAVLYLVIAALCTFLADPNQWSPIWTVALALYLPPRVAAVCAGIFWLISVRRGWLAALIGMVSAYAYVFASLGSTLMFLPALGVKQLPPDLPHLPHWQLLGIGLAWGLTAAAIMAAACRRWGRIDLDGLSR